MNYCKIRYNFGETACALLVETCDLVLPPINKPRQCLSEFPRERKVLEQEQNGKMVSINFQRIQGSTFYWSVPKLVDNAYCFLHHYLIQKRIPWGRLRDNSTLQWISSLSRDLNPHHLFVNPTLEPLDHTDSLQVWLWCKSEGENSQAAWSPPPLLFQLLT